MQNLQIKIAELRAEGVMNSTIYSQFDEKIINANKVDLFHIEEEISEIERKHWN